ncbi:hypothetical protein GCM10010424_70810 [Streptomyces lienomycini]
MYGLNGSYYPTVTLLTGYDLECSGALLDGFTQWLLDRKGEEPSFVWMALVLEENFPGTRVIWFRGERSGNAEE